MNTMLKAALTLTAAAAVMQASAQVTFYENDGFQGRSFTTQQQIGDFQRSGFNDRASSVMVQRDQWEVCTDAAFQGKCVVLRPGRYESLSAMGMNDRVSSVRVVSGNARVEDGRYAPAPRPYYDSRRRNNERLYQANVDSVRAVVGPPEQRCWIEREQIVQDHRSANVPGGIAGAVIGGILGHQIGGGTGRNLATVGGVVAGAAIGANVGRGGEQQVATQDVQRCASAPNDGRPDFWDVGYTFRGLEHHVQTTAPPGPTITVNRRGEPRG
jgi:uncharacterized protein YcfJ